MHGRRIGQEGAHRAFGLVAEQDGKTLIHVDDLLRQHRRQLVLAETEIAALGHSGQLINRRRIAEDIGVALAAALAEKLCARHILNLEGLQSSGIGREALETIAGCHPAVALAAVIARPDEKWGERPVLIIETRSGQTLDAEAILNSLCGKIAGWWIPDQIVRIAAMPLAVTGKIDKKRLRVDYASGKIAAEGENYFG